MERVEVHPEVLDFEHVFNKSAGVLQLVARLLKRQHHQHVGIAQDKHLRVQVQLSGYRAALAGGEEEDRQRYQEVPQEHCHPGGED